MNVYAFLDLDDTLFQTLPKCPPDEPRRHAAYRKDGAPLSFMTERQARLFELLDANAIVIPVTARNLDAFRRVDLRFRSLAILDFGGVILQKNGEPDADWDAVVRPQAMAMGGELEKLLVSIREFGARHALGVNARVITDFDMPLYVVVKHPEGDVTSLDRIRCEHLPRLDLQPFFIHANGNNLSVVPRFLGKERAVEHVLLRLPDGPRLTVGIGDSLSDVPFLRLCDFLMAPRESQLAESMFIACGAASRRGDSLR